jgi:hypothetical protein
VNAPFAATDVRGQFRSGVSERFDTFIRAEGPRMVTATLMMGVSTSQIVADIPIVGMGGMVDCRLCCVEAAGSQKDFQRHVAPFSHDQPVAMKMVIKPALDPVDLATIHKVDLVQDNHIRKCHLAEFQFHHLGRQKNLFSVYEADDAVEPDLAKPTGNRRR